MEADLIIAFRSHIQISVWTKVTPCPLCLFHSEYNRFLLAKLLSATNKKAKDI